ncbi:type II secretion system ATPase GspE [Bermanella marisrubri]|uniref:Type II secretion system protein E n=1 Tax=Bermanella marisrubri TaxID=207949 RepID=Q1N4G9_9GAMM|nr:Type II secretory pathway, ATPase PulE/Tfp pilus assembly pathway, ATPase PilB [Oceanobacter sp. RED65] [Bermanella marisrubri]
MEAVAEHQTPESEEQVDKRIPYGFAKRHGVVAEQQADGHYLIWFKEETPNQALIECGRILPAPLKFELSSEEDFNFQLSRIYQQGADSREAMEELGDDMDLASLAEAIQETADLMEQEDDAPIVRLINGILTDAIKRNASDVHIETFEKRLVVRSRVDGVLQEVLEPKRALAPLLVSRIKVMSKLDIAEKRIPQDGRIALRIAGREVDVRVSTMPSSHGERVVMRLLDKQAGRLDLAELGMKGNNLIRLKAILHKPHGIMLVTGPTGSGKTTTLYAGLSELNDRSRNILTVEDPIEYSLPGIGQTQVNTKVDMTFARGLRAILRQDPDVVMLGEIRDKETVEIAVQASLTGHMVLSTLHTNTAVGAVTRLQDMGIEPFLLASSLVGVVAQRLVRTLCPECKTPYEADEAEKELLGRPINQPLTLYHANGCAECSGTGYKGRRGIYEIIEIDDELKTLIHNEAGELELNRYARSQCPSIQQDGFEKVLSGDTTLEEVLRVTKA